jgi:hypothetical protein
MASSGYLTDLGLLALTSLVALVLGLGVFRLAERRARRLGLWDRKSEY